MFFSHIEQTPEMRRFAALSEREQEDEMLGTLEAGFDKKRNADLESNPDTHWISSWLNFVPAIAEELGWEDLPFVKRWVKEKTEYGISESYKSVNESVDINFVA